MERGHNDEGNAGKNSSDTADQKVVFVSIYQIKGEK